jgi:ATP-dependent helicase HrpB
MSYPVLKVVDELQESLKTNRVVILQAPPGAGKSTVLPLQLLDEPWLEGKNIIMLEPRRLAARSVALRMAYMLQQEIGESVGYIVRFDSKVTEKTNIKVVTEGILTRLMQSDNALSETGLIIFDEFHERSLHADTALALSLQVQQFLRPDLRILIMSATLDTEKLSTTLNAPVIKSTGQQYPVTVHYFAPDPQTNYINHTVKSIRRAMRDNSGDVLVFLPGAGEIKRVYDLLIAEGIEGELYPLYGDLPYKKQQEAILPDPQGRRKIVLATSIAETSLTIEGIGVVIDCGYARAPKFNPRSGLTTLDTVRVTADAADQRAGRAGRLGPGTCYRLWSEREQSHLISQRVPEILEADLAPFMLELFQWGVSDIAELTWITQPPSGAVSQAVDLLHELRALENNKITARGRAMLRLPTHPRIAHMLLEASSIDMNSAVALATDIASLLEEKDLLGKEAGADLTLRVDELRRWRRGERAVAERTLLERIEKLAAAWRRLMNINEDNQRPPESIVGRLLLEAYPERIAKQVEKNSERYKLANGRIAKLPQHDPLIREQWLAIANLDAGSGEGKIFLAAPVAETDLERQATEREIVRWDEERQAVVGKAEKVIGPLVLSSRQISKIPDQLRISELCKVVNEKGLKLLGWDDEEDQWQARVMSLKTWRPTEAWPNVDEQTLLNSVNDWLAPFLVNVYKASELQKLNLLDVLNALLPWELSSRLTDLAPERLTVPSGSNIKIRYSKDGSSPVMEVRLQEVFGLTETPTVNEGRTKVILHLLSPGFKPVQVTQDLKSFWNSTYADVRKELRTRYPKHSWPEDPWTAEAVRGAKRRA